MCFSLNLSNRNKKQNNGNKQKSPLKASKPPTVFTTGTSLINLGSLNAASDVMKNYKLAIKQ